MQIFCPFTTYPSSKKLTFFNDLSSFLQLILLTELLSMGKNSSQRLFVGSNSVKEKFLSTSLLLATQATPCPVSQPSKNYRTYKFIKLLCFTYIYNTIFSIICMFQASIKLFKVIFHMLSNGSGCNLRELKHLCTPLAKTKYTEKLI